MEKEMFRCNLWGLIAVGLLVCVKAYPNTVQVVRTDVG